MIVNGAPSVEGGSYILFQTLICLALPLLDLNLSEKSLVSAREVGAGIRPFHYPNFCAICAPLRRYATKKMRLSCKDLGNDKTLCCRLRRMLKVGLFRKALGQ